MFNKAMFFVMMAKWKQQLLDHSVEVERNAKRQTLGSASSHWRPVLIKTGVMERAYMEYLLENDDFIGAIKKRTGTFFHALPEISLSQLKSRLSLMTLSTVDSISKQLAKDDKPHVFLIGQLNHWIAIVSNRVKNHGMMDCDEINDDSLTKRGEMEMTSMMEVETNENFSFGESSSEPSPPPPPHIHQYLAETILLDSRNDFVLNMHADDIPNRVNKRVNREFGPKTNRTMWHELCIRLYEQSLRDTQYSCDMFHSLTIQPRKEGNINSSDSSSHPIPSSRSSKSSKSSKSSSSATSTTTTTTTELESPHPITTDLIILYVNGFFEAFATHVGDSISLLDDPGFPIIYQDPPSDSSKTRKTSRSKSANSTSAEHTEIPKHTDIADWVFKFTLWVQEYSPLRTIEDNFIMSLRGAKKAGYVVPMSVPNALTRWIILLKARIAQAQLQSATSEDSDQIIEDLLENTIPYIISSCKYLRR
jgi:hypothetical protein